MSTSNKEEHEITEHQDLLDLETVNANSGMDCTGLIPAAPVSKSEEEAYEDVYSYQPQYVEPGEEE